MKIESFQYIANENAKVLILGTMPGNDSLKAGQYYDHHNNIFWDIIFRVCYPDWKCSEVVTAEYETKKSLLLSNSIALWDVLKFCDRERSSLDRHIRNQIHNEFNLFFQQFTKIRAVFFNGKDAAKYFDDFKPDPIIFSDRVFITLQSTSPSNKTNAFRILNEWMQIRDFITTQ